MTQAVILAGGSGTRFWPASRRLRPKQLLALDGDRSLLQGTVDRNRPLIEPRNTWICTAERLDSEVKDQLPEVPTGQVLLEPVGRNTLAAIGWTVRSMPAPLRREPIVVLPADHRVADGREFRTVLAQAIEIVSAEDRVMTLGVKPDRAEAGYGYLELGEELDPSSGLRGVRRFTEKPNLEDAQRFVESGEYLWNAGIFIFRGDTLLRHIEEFEPAIADGLETIAEEPERLAEVYEKLESISIDCGVMERLTEIGTLSLDCGWSDLGSWEALVDLLPTDEAGNAERGDVVAVDCSENLFYVDEGTVAALGVTGLVVVKAGERVLVMPRERSQDVREIVAALEHADRRDLL